MVVVCVCVFGERGGGLHRSYKERDYEKLKQWRRWRGREVREEDSMER